MNPVRQYVQGLNLKQSYENRENLKVMDSKLVLKVTGLQINFFPRSNSAPRSKILGVNLV